MPHVTKIAKQGNSLGVRIPKEMLEQTGLNLGDEVVLDMHPGQIRISRAENNYNRAMDLGREFASRYRRTLAKLAQ